MPASRSSPCAAQFCRRRKIIFRPVALHSHPAAWPPPLVTCMHMHPCNCLWRLMKPLFPTLDLILRDRHTTIAAFFLTPLGCLSVPLLCAGCE